MYRLDVCGRGGGSGRLGFPCLVCTFVFDKHFCWAATGQRTTESRKVLCQQGPPLDWRKPKVHVRVCCCLKISAHGAWTHVETCCKLPACVHLQGSGRHAARIFRSKLSRGAAQALLACTPAFQHPAPKHKKPNAQAARARFGF